MAASIPGLPREWFVMDEISTEELARQQGVRPVLTVADLAALARPDAWESDEEFQDFLADLYVSRRSDIQVRTLKGSVLRSSPTTWCFAASA